MRCEAIGEILRCIEWVQLEFSLGFGSRPNLLVFNHVALVFTNVTVDETLVGDFGAKQRRSIERVNMIREAILTDNGIGTNTSNGKIVDPKGSITGNTSEEHGKASNDSVGKLYGVVVETRRCVGDSGIGFPKIVRRGTTFAGKERGKQNRF